MRISRHLPMRPAGLVAALAGTLALVAPAMSVASAQPGAHGLPGPPSSTSVTTSPTPTTPDQQVTSTAPATVAASGTPNPVKAGRGVTYAAVVACTGAGDPTGQVRFLDNGAIIGVALPGFPSDTNQRTYTLPFPVTAEPPGTHVITGEYTSSNPICADGTGTTTQTVRPVGTSGTPPR